MTVVHDAIVEGLAELTRDQEPPEPPEPPHGYGTDLSCVTDLTPGLAEVSGLVLLREACVRRLTTPRGAVPDEPDYGLDVRLLLNSGRTVEQIQEWQGRAAGELSKDDRVESAAVTLTFDLATDALDIAIELRPAIVGAEPFRFTFAIDSAGAVILERLK